MTAFGEQLKKLTAELSCSLSLLAQRSGLSKATLSRYCSGERHPKRNSGAIEKIARGLADIAAEKGIALDEAEMLRQLTATADVFETADLPWHFSRLIAAYQVSIAELSRNISYDASYLSKIKNGQRLPNDPENFVACVCRFIVQRFSHPEGLQTAAALTGCDLRILDSKEKYYAELTRWFGRPLSQPAEPIDGFLKNLNDFDMNQYIRALRFERETAQPSPSPLPMTRDYYGTIEMRQGELDFFQATLTSPSPAPLFMYCDLPMTEMAEDLSFGKQWMTAVAGSLQKGLHLDIIHHIDRPFNEMLLGLESWVPIYMTGQVSPYYFRDHRVGIFRNLTYVSGGAALSGECISGYHNDGKYHLTRNDREIEYCRRKAELMLSKAEPLMTAFRAKDRQALQNFLLENRENAAPRRNVYASLPLYTITPELLKQILDENQLSEEEKRRIAATAAEQQEGMAALLEKTTMTDEISALSEEAFTEAPLPLSVPEAFCDREIHYTYAEYRQHLALTEAWAAANPNYTVKKNPAPAFRNLDIHIAEDQWVLIAKKKGPVIHFLIRHPKMQNAIQNFYAPMVEK